ncbi:putative hydrolase [Nonomuraea coxensis DSM 45129]|uniref:Hydrolase n=1 Tax=Nonomuraea coxensis DSM 45129 TaxID=1122611 RepID=A0ABX8U0Q6_9ACTN|nr:alpha/beta hydrolase [Nonomuraea coxensis]QYC41036.1 putative hydrolase [Nonomuraea coxensis DSM 45129]
MEAIRTGTLTTPGATLYHEVRGSGPILLLICGGVYDAAGFSALAATLADRYTVITYDRRGNSRSPLDGPPEAQSVEVHADDAARLLVAAGVTPEQPALVFGNSSGAAIGLELAARRPELVRALVAHEPPLFELLPERDRWRALFLDVEKTFRQDGPDAAHRLFAAGLDGAPEGGSDAGQEGGPAGGEAPEGEPDPEIIAMMGRLASNATFFIGYEAPYFSRHVPDLAAVRAAGVRVVPALGAATAEDEPYARATRLVAERLGAEIAPFPGDHGGFGTDPAAFGEALRKTLATC